MIDVPFHMTCCSNDKICSSDKAREFFDKVGTQVKQKVEYDRDHDLLA
jgi:hypothetical protein